MLWPIYVQSSELIVHNPITVTPAEIEHTVVQLDQGVVERALGALAAQVKALAGAGASVGDVELSDGDVRVVPIPIVAREGRRRRARDREALERGVRALLCASKTARLSRCNTIPEQALRTDANAARATREREIEEAVVVALHVDDVLGGIL